MERYLHYSKIYEANYKIKHIDLKFHMASPTHEYTRHRIFRNKRRGRLIFWSNKKTFQNPSKAIGFVYSPLWKSLFLVRAYFGVGVYLSKYGVLFCTTVTKKEEEENLEFVQE